MNLKDQQLSAEADVTEFSSDLHKDITSAISDPTLY